MLTLTSPIETWLHLVPAGIKLALLCLVTICLFGVRDLWLASGILLAIAILYLSFGWRFSRHGARMLKPLVPFIVIVLIWHLWTADLSGGLLIVLRLVTAVAIANLVTMTTRLSDMVAVVERVTPSVPWLGLKPRAVALSMALTVRFIPVLSQKVGQINSAWKARSARRPNWRILVPIILAVLDDAEHVAEALRARGGME